MMIIMIDACQCVACRCSHLSLKNTVTPTALGKSTKFVTTLLMSLLPNVKSARRATAHMIPHDIRQPWTRKSAPPRGWQVKKRLQLIKANAVLQFMLRPRMLGSAAHISRLQQQPACTAHQPTWLQPMQHKQQQP
jgi:hypothetical protein